MKFGFIGFGEVSYTLSKMLLSYGFEVLTSTEGRSKKTKELVKSLNLTVWIVSKRSLTNLTF